MASNRNANSPTAPDFEEISLEMPATWPYSARNDRLKPNPIVSQPKPGAELSDWMNRPTGFRNCPSGLEYLASIDQLLIERKFEALEIFLNITKNAKFVVKNTLGQNVYWAIEETGDCCGLDNPNEIKLFDIYNKEIMNFSCPFQCNTQSLEVSSPPSQMIGRIDQERNIFYPHFSVKNHNGDTILRIEGQLNRFLCSSEAEFKIFTLNGNEVGKISKKWTGLMHEMVNDSENFGLCFPMDLDIRIKAVLLGASILIDSMYYKNNKWFDS